MQKPLISIIIPAYNEEELLPRLLTTLSEQDFKDFEVILVDASSTDKTVFFAKTYAKSLPITILHTNVHNVSVSRNLGADKASGSYLFFIDADNYIHKDFLLRIAPQIQKNYQLIVTAVLPDSQDNQYKFSYHIANLAIQLAWKFNLTFSTGGNFIVESSLFRKLKGFDKTIFVGEDHDLVTRARKMHSKIIFVKNPKVIFSTRRLKKEGWAMVLKYFFSSIYILIFGKITKKMYNYEMGGEYYKKSK